jgi:O-antigen/teichoic acid export membrane protein
MSSLCNAAMSFYVARELGPPQFGAFSIAYVTYSFALNASRGLATEPLLVRFSDAKPSAWRNAVSRSTGTAVVAGIALGTCALIAGVLLTGSLGVGFIALGLTLPGLMLQDSWRYAFFAVGRGGHSFLNDTIWTVAMIPGILVLRLTHHDTVFWFVLMWGLAATLAACVGPLQARVLPRPLSASEWVIRHRDLGPRFLAENTSSAGASQLRTYCIGGIAGLATVGYVQAASLLMGPFLVVFMGISIVTVPEAARIVRSAPRRLRQYCFLVGAGLAVACGLWGAALLIAVPRGLGELLLGRELWRPAYQLVIPYTISIMGSCFTDGANAGLHALGAAKRSLRSMIFASLMYLGFGIIGAYLDGAVGVVWGAAFATWFGAALWWRQLHIAMQEAGHWSPARMHSGLSAWGRPGLPVPQVSAAVPEPAARPGEYQISPPGMEA